MKENESEDEQDSRMLNEEQRSLIVEEILKNDQEFIFEVSSDEDQLGHDSSSESRINLSRAYSSIRG